jgi:hypothetical protein
MEAGVPQGSVLSPTLYKLYINDTPQATNLHLALFADDTCLYATDRKEGYIVVDLLHFSVDFDITDQLLSTYSAFVRYWRKKWKYNETVHQLFINKKVYDSASRKVLYNILIEFGIPIKLVGLIKYV